MNSVVSLSSFSISQFVVQSQFLECFSLVFSTIAACEHPAPFCCHLPVSSYLFICFLYLLLFYQCVNRKRKLAEETVYTSDLVNSIYVKVHIYFCSK